MYATKKLLIDAYSHFRCIVYFDLTLLISSFILKCLVKRKEARENKLPEVIQEVKTETENKASIVC